MVRSELMFLLVGPKFLTDVAHTGSSLWDARKAVGPYGGPEELLAPEFVAATKENKLKASKTEIGPLGSGSDYTVFLQRLGVRTLISVLYILAAMSL